MREKLIILIVIIIITLLLFTYQGYAASYTDDQQPGESAALILERMIAEKGVDLALEEISELRKSGGDKYSFVEDEFLALGNRMRSTGKVEQAIKVLKAGTGFFPDSAGIWYALSQAYVRTVRKDQALDCLKKAAELDPKDFRPREEQGWIDMRLTNAERESREPVKYEPGTLTPLKGPYLGQKPPGMKPEKFAPGIVSVYGSNENTITFSPDGREIYFGREAGIWICRMTEDGWSAPEPTDIDGYEMHISRWTGKMYYTGYSTPGIFVMDRTADGWSEPRKVLEQGMFTSVTKDETIYTCVFSGGVKVGRYFKTEDGYAEADILGKEINSSGFDGHPNISFDESVLVFDSQRRPGNGFSNLFVSFRKEDGSWSNAVYLGDEINMPGTNNCSSYSPDGKYLFYTAHDDIYWVDAKILDNFRPDK